MCKCSSTVHGTYAYGPGWLTGIIKFVSLAKDTLPNFQDVLKKAKASCEESGQAVSDHFGDVTDMITVGKGANQPRSEHSFNVFICIIGVVY